MENTKETHSSAGDERVIVYVDGFNLYYGLNAKGWRRFDVRLLAENLLRSGQVLAMVLRKSSNQTALSCVAHPNGNDGSPKKAHDSDLTVALPLRRHGRTPRRRGRSRRLCPASPTPMEMTARRKKLIEVALPLNAINAASAREKSIRHGHPSTLPLWWTRRPLAGKGGDPVVELQTNFGGDKTHSMLSCAAGSRSGRPRKTPPTQAAKFFSSKYRLSSIGFPRATQTSRNRVRRFGGIAATTSGGTLLLPQRQFTVL